MFRSVNLVLALALGLVVNEPAEAQEGQPLAMRPEFASCVAEALPLAYCSTDSASDWLLTWIWNAAADRLDQPRGTGVFLTRDPGSEGYGLPIQAVRLLDAATYDYTPGPHPPRWIFVRSSISTRDVGDAFNEVWDPDKIDAGLRAAGLTDFEDAIEANRAFEFLPNGGAIAARLPVTTEIAEVESCPGLRGKLDELEGLLGQTKGMNIEGVGPDRDTAPNHRTADWIQILRVNGVLEEGASAAVRYEVDAAHPLGRWQSEMFDLLQPCWRPTKDQFY